MLSKKEAQRSFGNGPLRDRWEQRAQSMADQCKQEAEWREKSALKGLYSKWTYHWSLGSNGDVSDFSKLTCRKDEDNNKPKIKFKVVPPPPKPKPEAPPPPPPPRRKASPKPRRPKRKVEVDVFRLCWKESWMSLKPPKYLYLKARELKNTISEFAAIELTDKKKYKAKLSSEAEPPSPQGKWILSWKQVKSSAQMKPYDGSPFQWAILFERSLVWEADIEEYSLPLWAGTWKIMNFAFRQQKHKWDQMWLENFAKKPERFQQLETQDELTDWECSWKLSGPQLECEDSDTDNETLNAACSSAVAVRIDVFLPDWSNSWLLSAATPEEDQERRQNWFCSWGYRQQIRWRKASLKSHHQHNKMLTQRRKTTSLFLMSQLDDEVPDVMEWMEAWITPKGQAEIRADEQQDDEEEREVEQVKNETEEDKDEVDSMVNIETYDEEEEKDEGVDEEEEEGEEKEDEEVEEAEEEDEVMEYVNKNEEVKEETGLQKKKEDVDISQLDIDKEYDEDKDEGVDEEEGGEEEDEVSEKEEDTDVEEDEEDSEQRDKEKDRAEEDEEEEDDDKNDQDEEEEDSQQKDEEEDIEEDKEEDEEEEEENNQDEEEEDIAEKDRNKIQIEEDEEEEEEVEDNEAEEKVNNRNKSCEEEEEEEEDDKQSDMDERDEGDDEELDVEGKNNDDDDKENDKGHEVVEEEEEEEDDEKEEEDEEENDKGHEVVEEEEEEEEDDEKEEEDEEENDKGHEVVEEEEEEDEEEGVKVDDDMNQAVEKGKNKQRRVKDTPLHLQFHKLNATFSSWRKSWMVAVAHRGGQDNRGEEEEEEEQRDWWAWKESWRICRWKKPDEDEVACFSSRHRFRRRLALTRGADAAPRSGWADSWKMKAAAREEEEDTS